MPRKTKHVKAPVAKTDTPEVQSVQVRIIPDSDDKTPSFYGNCIEVAHSPFDFSITVGKASSKISELQKKEILETQTLHCPATLQLLLPITVIPSFIQALQTQLNQYEAFYGSLPKP